MKAAYYEGNRTISVGESVPKAPAPGEVKLKVAYCGICGTDYHIFLGHRDKDVKRPQVIGHEMSGKVVEVGEGVEGFEPGDRVVVRPLAPCRACPACELGHYNICPHLNFLGIGSPGAFQAWWTVPADTLHHLPDSVDTVEAALIEPVAVACHDVRYGEVTDNDYVVVQGAGPIGILVALVAKARGANVLSLELNKHRLQLARDLSLDALSPSEADIPDYVEKQTGTAGADVVFEVTGSAAGAELMTRLVRSRGRIVIVGIFMAPTPVDLRRILWREMRVCGARNYDAEDFDAAIEMVASKRLPLERLISDIRPLERLQETFEAIDRGENLMKVLFRCSD